MNRLAGQTSPYLLQHAHNPVPWQPWDEQALAEARRRGVPIFLSIGYSTCYWCHVMERESFESEAIARKLAADFVSIKLDREERPDLDELYMAATVISTGSGGWPMSVFLEPATLKPFFCGTYFPPAAAHARPGFADLLASIADAWKTRRTDVLKQADAIADAVRAQLDSPPSPVALGPSQVADAVASLLRLFDRTHAGFGLAPKFPQPVLLDLLLDARARVDPDTRTAIDQALRATLDAMAAGGINDHLAGGFHRYSVDAAWTVPHFEKMLYDNAQLALAYANAGASLAEPAYERVARRTLDFLLADMTGPAGAFHSALDAEADGREGLNYLWTPGEFRRLLGPDADFAIRCFGLDKEPNFQDPHHREDPPAYVLRLADRLDRMPEKFGMTPAAFDATFERVRRALLDHRRTRKQPRLDDKSLASWNAMTIHALAECARVWNDPACLAAAERAASYLLDTHRARDATLLRVSRAGSAHTPAFLEDYAWLIRALCSLRRAGSTARPWLDEAARLLAEARAAFADATTGALYDTRAGAADLFVRARPTHDGAVPCASSVFIHAMLDLADLNADAPLRRAAIDSLLACSDRIAASPLGCANSVRALLRVLVEGQHEALSAPGAPHLRGGSSAPPAPPQAQPIEVYAGIDRITVTKTRPASLTLLVKIAEPYHVAAADPGDAAGPLHPFRVHIINGTGVSAYADYPPGELFGEGANQIRVYRGEFELTVALERTGDTKGRPLLAVSAQACTDAECLAPVTLELDIAID